jgi:hypothetical protein
MEVDEDDDEQVDTESLKLSESCIEVNSEEAESSKSSTKPVTRYSAMVKLDTIISAPAQQPTVDTISYEMTTPNQVEQQDDTQTQEPKVIFRAFQRKAKKFPLSFECQICLKVKKKLHLLYFTMLPCLWISTGPKQQQLFQISHAAAFGKNTIPLSGMWSGVQNEKW